MIVTCRDWVVVGDIGLAFQVGFYCFGGGGRLDAFDKKGRVQKLCNLILQNALINGLLMQFLGLTTAAGFKPRGEIGGFILHCC